MVDEKKNKITVMIVDDNEPLLDLLTQAFEAVDWSVVAATDGEEVFRKINAYKPDAILMDIYMPKLNGAEACRLIKGHPEWKKCKLIIMSSRISDNDRTTYLNMGADDILPKPFHPQKAIDIFNALLSEKK